MTWSFDISSAPRGHNITVMRTARSKDGVTRVPVKEFEPDHVWLATICGKVIKSYWIPETDKNEGRWAGFATKEQPKAWQPFIVPVHPDQKTAAATDSPEAWTPLGNIEAAVVQSGAGAVESVCPALIDDVGSV